MRVAAAGICLLKCFWRCFCCTFRANPEKCLCQVAQQQQTYKAVLYKQTGAEDSSRESEERYGEYCEAGGDYSPHPSLKD